MAEPVRRAPRIGLGPDRVDPERARFRSAADLLRYLCDLDGLTQARLAARCGVRREQLTRWMTRAKEPTLARLDEALEPLGWRLVLSLERTDQALDELLGRSPELYDLIGNSGSLLLGIVGKAATRGLDVAVGGEFAAVLQGVAVPTTHVVLHTRPQHLDQLLRLAITSYLTVEEDLDGTPLIRSGAVLARVRAEQRWPATRLVVTEDDESPLPVVDLAELLGQPDGVGPSVRAAAGRLTRRVG